MASSRSAPGPESLGFLYSVLVGKCSEHAQEILPAVQFQGDACEAGSQEAAAIVAEQRRVPFELFAEEAFLPSVREQASASEEGASEPRAQAGIHCNALLEDFFQRCLQEEVDQPCEPWSTGSMAYRDINGTAADSIWFSPALPPSSPAPVEAFQIEAGGQPLMTFHPTTTVAVQGGLLASEEGAAVRSRQIQSAMPGLGEGAAQQALPQPPHEQPGQLRQRRDRRRHMRALPFVKAASRVSIFEPQVAPEACPICLDPISNNQVVRTLPCFHVLHNSCSKRYFQTRGVLPCCPVCRCLVGLHEVQDAALLQAE